MIMEGVDYTLLEKCRESLKKYYWNRLRGDRDATKDVLLKPFLEMADYIYKAWKARLDKKNESLYAGSLMFDSVLKGTGRRFTSDVVEANEVCDVGRRLANQMWDQLEAMKGDLQVFKGLVSKMVTYLLEGKS